MNTLWIKAQIIIIINLLGSEKGKFVAWSMTSSRKWKSKSNLLQQCCLNGLTLLAPRWGVHKLCRLGRGEKRFKNPPFYCIKGDKFGGGGRNRQLWDGIFYGRSPRGTAKACRAGRYLLGTLESFQGIKLVKWPTSLKFLPWI